MTKRLDQNGTTTTTKRRNTISLQNNRSSQCIACAFFISKAVGYCVWMVHNDYCHFHHIPGRSFGSSTQTKQTNENENHLNMKTLYQENYSILLPCSASQLGPKKKRNPKRERMSCHMVLLSLSDAHQMCTHHNLELQRWTNK